jgi:hypothetical protein
LNTSAGDSAKGRQKELTKLIDQKRAGDAMDAAINSGDQVTRRRLQAASQRGAGMWLTTVPSSQGLRLRDDEYRHALMHLLGTGPAPLPRVCQACRKRPINWSHPHSCTKLKRRCKTVAHNLVAAAIIRAAREVGCSVRSEPDSADRSRHPDIRISGTCPNILVDVTMVHPTSRTQLHGTAAALLKGRENAKVNKYRAMADAQHARFFPAVFTTYGGKGRQVKKLFKAIYDTAIDKPLSYHAFVHRGLRGVSVAIQRGNARVMDEGALSMVNGSGDLM